MAIVPAPITDEQAKAIQATAHLGSDALAVIREFGGYCAAILGTLPHDLVGLIGADYLKVRRAENMVSITRKAFERLSNAKIEPKPAALAVGIPILQGAADESREELADLWAGLLATALNPKTANKVRYSFVATIKQMDPLDALVFRKAIPGGNFMPTPIIAFATLLGRNNDDVEVSLERLMDLKCVGRGGSIGIVPITPFGREFARALQI